MLDVVMVRTGLVARKPRRERLRGQSPVDDRENDQHCARDGREPDEGALAAQRIAAGTQAKSTFTIGAILPDVPDASLRSPIRHRIFTHASARNAKD